MEHDSHYELSDGFVPNVDSVIGTPTPVLTANDIVIRTVLSKTPSYCYPVAFVLKMIGHDDRCANIYPCMLIFSSLCGITCGQRPTRIDGLQPLLTSVAEAHGGARANGGSNVYGFEIGRRN